METAVTSASASISYGELNARSNKLAKRLISQGIGRGDFIGLGLPRSLDLPVALLAILKAGAGYVPLDPHCPPERLQEIMISAKLRHVITHKDLAEHFSGVRTVLVDDSSSRGRVRPFCAEFTPGSGEIAPFPFPHHGAANLLRWYSINLDIEAGEQNLSISKPSFDLTRRNFFSALITGGTLVLEDCLAYDASRIAKLVRRHGVSSIHCPTDAFYKLLEAAADTEYVALAGLRFAILDGEKASLARLRPWLDHLNCHIEITSTQGYTENTGRVRSPRIRFPELRDLAPERSEVAPNQRGLSDPPTKPSWLRKPLSHEILSLWTKVLRRTVNDPEANFFELGGTPIHLAIVHVQLMKMSGRKFPLHELFELPTAAMIARFLAAPQESAGRGTFARATQGAA